MNQINNLAEVVVAVVVAVIPFIFKQLEEWLEKNQTAKTVVSILPTIAKDAVVITEKLGVEEELTGNIKNLKAVQSVSEALKNLGFTDVDKQIIENAVESAYAELVKSGTLSVYKPDDKQETQQAEENKQEQPQVEQAKQATNEQ
ncbi:holin [Lactobacillus phage Ldl1]|uniref:Holin n=1 Tax=Lactobacillus phage Ldl1 TaxID=1552735 RepID=A0A0A7DMV7_9CAUD|nr:holin [Lactobacillus phage Ldl1]AIS73891.1 holin [Lactobacillus phage Ldl1]